MTTLDQYVLGLAVANTPCFGYHERGNATCGDCPLAERCIDSRSLRAVTVAAQLVETAKAASRVAKPTPAPSVGVPVTPASMPSSAESIDDILDSIARTPATAQTVSTFAPAAPADFDLESLFGDVLKPDATAPVAPPAPPVQAAPAPVPQAPRVTVMKAVIDSVCFVCNGKVPAKSEAAFIPGKGLRHMSCA